MTPRKAKTKKMNKILNHQKLKKKKNQIEIKTMRTKFGIKTNEKNKKRIN
jgi:hypothetical protein